MKHENASFLRPFTCKKDEQMDKLTVETTFFRSKPVHFQKEVTANPFFRSISVHFYVFFSYLCTGKSVNTSTYMAGTVKEMSLIKQVLQLKQLGESNRGIARKLPINKETVNGYMNTIETNGWDIGELLKIDDPELERMFHAGSPAYTDARMKEFLRLPTTCSLSMTLACSGSRVRYSMILSKLSMTGTTERLLSWQASYQSKTGTMCLKVSS